jgi:putative transposase
MCKNRYCEEQIIATLKEAEHGKVTEVIRRHGIAQKTYYNWKAKYGGLEVSEARRLKALEDENRRLLRALAEQRPRFGYRRLHVLLEQEGFEVNRKRVWRALIVRIPL